MKQYEAGEQRILAEWLNLIDVLWCHVPNGGARDCRVGAELKRQGVKRGVPDALIFDVPDVPEMHTVHGVAIELKVGVNRLTAFQEIWADRMKRAGWLHFVAIGAHDAITKLRNLGYDPRAKWRRQNHERIVRSNA